MSKEAIIGQRRRSQGKARVGQLLFSMFKQKKQTLTCGIDKICNLLKTDYRTFKRNIFFRIFPQQNKNGISYFHLTEEDFQLIAETEKIFNKIKKLDPQQQKIIQYTFLFLRTNGSRI